MVEDTWDTKITDRFVFEPGGTNIEEGKNFVLNNHGFFGYIKGKEKTPFDIEIKKPIGFYGSTGLSNIEIGLDKDIYHVASYHELVDSPIMYCAPDTANILVGGANILVSLYSVEKNVTAKYIAKSIATVLNAQKEYLGGVLPVQKYAFIIYLTNKITLSGATGALEHSYSSLYSLMESDSISLAQNMTDVAAHEFFHVVTPLSIHSEEIGDFDFNAPKMSKHLWFYEGLTEYAAHHVQVKFGLIDIDQFMEIMTSKMEESQKYYNDSLSFTEMSKGVLEKYHKEYQNVYAKGALIGMSLDILLRYYSSGKYGTQNLVADLSKKYGKEKAFIDDEFFDDIERISYPEVRAFLDNYVAKGNKMPYKDVFDKVGFNYIEKETREEISLGGFGMGISNESNRLVIFDTQEMNEFGKQMKYKDGDEIISVNGKNINADNYKEVFGSVMNNIKAGDKLVVEVARKNKKGKESTKKLKSKVRPVMVTFTNIIRLNKNPNFKQIIARNAWLGLTNR